MRKKFILKVKTCGINPLNIVKARLNKNILKYMIALSSEKHLVY